MARKRSFRKRRVSYGRRFTSRRRGTRRGYSKKQGGILSLPVIAAAIAVWYFFVRKPTTTV
jgi:hypothetical protein